MFFGRSHFVHHTCLRVLALCVALVWSGSALAGDALVVGQVEVYPTISNAGITVAYTDDDNENASVSIRYRRKGASGFRRGHSLLRIRGRRFVGSLFGLNPSTTYEFELSFQDPDGTSAPYKGTLTTRANEPPAAPADGNDIYVSATSGKDGNPGTKAAPLATIQAAATRAKAGDTVHVAPGVYRESVTIRNAGTATRPIRFLAEGKGVILDGADPTIAKTPTWRDEGDGIYSTAFAKTSVYVAAGDVRLYDYQKMADFRAANGKISGRSNLIKGGFYIDASAKRLYVRLPNRSSPRSVTLHVAVLNVGIRLETTKHIVIRGFEIRYYGGQTYGDVGIDIRNSSDNWIQDNWIHHINSGIIVRKTAVASRNVIERNRLRDTSVWGWNWSSVKGKTAEATAISITHGRGNIVRNNETEGFFNGIYVGSFQDASESVAQDTDILNNRMREHGDDGLEPEGACLNVRMLNNKVIDVHNGLSLAPIRVGPLWSIRSVFHRFTAHALKLNNGSTGWMMVYHNIGTPAPTSTSAQPMAPTVPFGGLVARNNIWVSPRYIIEYGGASLKGPVSMDYDVMWSTRAKGGPWFKWLNQRYNDIAALFKGTQLAEHSIAAQPRFVDAPNGNLQPTVNSPVIDRGVWIDGVNRHDAAGKAPDVGAYEWKMTTRQEPTASEATREIIPDSPLSERAVQEVASPTDAGPLSEPVAAEDRSVPDIPGSGIDAGPLADQANGSSDGAPDAQRRPQTGCHVSPMSDVALVWLLLTCLLLAFRRSAHL